MQALRELTQAEHPNYTPYSTQGHVLVGLTIAALVSDVALSLFSKSYSNITFAIYTVIIAYPITVLSCFNAKYKFATLTPPEWYKESFGYPEAVKIIIFMFLAARYSTNFSRIFESQIPKQELALYITFGQIMSAIVTGYTLGRDIDNNAGHMAVERYLAT